MKFVATNLFLQIAIMSGGLLYTVVTQICFPHYYKWDNSLLYHCKVGRQIGQTVEQSGSKGGGRRAQGGGGGNREEKDEQQVEEEEQEEVEEEEEEEEEGEDEDEEEIKEQDKEEEEYLHLDRDIQREDMYLCVQGSSRVQKM